MKPVPGDGLGAKSDCNAIRGGSKRGPPRHRGDCSRSPVDPLKAAAATAVCLVLFWLAFRLTRRLVDMAIAGGYAEEQRRLAEEEAQAAEGAVPQASAICATAASLAANSDQSSAAAIGAQSASTSSISIVQGSPAK